MQELTPRPQPDQASRFAVRKVTVQTPVQGLVGSVSDMIQAHQGLNGATGGPQVDSCCPQLSTILGARWAAHNLSDSLQRVEGKFWSNVFPVLTGKTPKLLSLTWQGGVESVSKTLRCLEMPGIILQAKQRSFVSRQRSGKSCTETDSFQLNPRQFNPNRLVAPQPLSLTPF